PKRVAGCQRIGQTSAFRRAACPASVQPLTRNRVRANPCRSHRIMQVSVESTGNLERRVILSLPAGDVDTQVGGRLREIARTARIKGFRPGKVPTKVIEQ